MSRDTLKAFTERAIEATELGKLIPPIVYLPKRLRLQGQRLTVDNVKVTVTPPTIKENHLRIADADPLGFLIAIMHGQPIPAFQVTRDGAIEINYFTPDPEMRITTARFLAHKVTLRAGADNKAQGKSNELDRDWDTIVEERETRGRLKEQS